MKVYAINYFENWDSNLPICVAATDEAAARFLVENEYIYIGQPYWNGYVEKSEITQQDIDFILTHPLAEWCEHYELFCYEEYEIVT